MMLSKSHQLVFALLLCTSRVAAIGTIPQIILNEPNPCPNPPSGNQCGFWYPGLYRIINYGFQYAATMNDSTPGAAVVSMPWNDTDLAQQWGIMYTDASENVTMIFNRATGTALSAVQSRKPVRAVNALPYDKRTHWTIDRDTFADVEGNPIVFINLGISGVLDLSGTKKHMGTPVLLYPKNKPVTRNQGWYLQILTPIHWD